VCVSENGLKLGAYSFTDFRFSVLDCCIGYYFNVNYLLCHTHTHNIHNRPSPIPRFRR